MAPSFSEEHIVTTRMLYLVRDISTNITVVGVVDLTLLQQDLRILITQL